MTNKALAPGAQTAACAACGARELVAHIVVAAPAGDQWLIPSTTQFGSALADIARCGRCGHMQLDPMPDSGMLARAYAHAASEDYIAEETGQRATGRRALERIETYLPGRGALLDVGCWLGFLPAEARDRGWRPLGLEPSAFACAYARERLGLEVQNADLFSAQLPASAFDAVTMGDVIEQLRNPGEALLRIASLMRPGGVLWLALPDAGSRVARRLGRRWWSVLPTHVQYFTRGSITSLLARCGFQVLEIATAPKALTMRYYLDRIGGYSPGLGLALSRTAGLARVDRRIWAPDFRDRMAVIARPFSAAR